MARLQLRELCGYRAGDKGDIANVAIFADDDAAYELIVREVTAERGEGALRRDGAGVTSCATRPATCSPSTSSCRARSAAAGPARSAPTASGKTLGGALVRLEIDVPDELAARRRPRPDVAWARAILDALPGAG